MSNKPGFKVCHLLAKYLFHKVVVYSVHLDGTQLFSLPLTLHCLLGSSNSTLIFIFLSRSIHPIKALVQIPYYLSPRLFATASKLAPLHQRFSWYGPGNPEAP